MRPPSDTPAAAPPPAPATAPAPPAASERRLPRFTRAERWVHRATALLMGSCLLTAAILYVPQLAEFVGRRRTVVLVHEWSGLLLPAPVLFGIASRAFRADLRLLNRFGPHDMRWLRAVARRPHLPDLPAGKFNAGQKVFAAFTAGTGLVMLGTGLLMWFTHLTPLVWRTSATFVHDWLTVAIAVVVGGHVWLALADPEARRGLRTGRVSAAWAEREHALWRPADPDPAEDSGKDRAGAGESGPGG